jgi:predicted kinase
MPPLVVFLRGLPGAGKSTLAKLLAPQINAKILEPHIINKSAVRFIEAKTTEPKTRDKIIQYRLLLDSAINTIKKCENVIWAQPWRKAENIQLTMQKILKMTDAIFLTIELECTPEESWQIRKHRFGSKAHFNRYIKKYKTLPKDIPQFILNRNDENKVGRILAQVEQMQRNNKL